MAQARRVPLAVTGIFLLAGIVGALGGLAGWSFRQALQWIQLQLMGQGGSIVAAGQAMGPVMTVLVPTIGGVAAGLFLWALGRVHTPFGISDIMDMVGHRRSFIAPFRSLVQVMSSACSLATGGSLGREGAITQMGTTIASIMGGVYEKGSRRRIVILACGTAAGMASSYNAPLAGAIFVMEVILGSFAMEIFAPLVVASVSSAVVTRALPGGDDAIYASTVNIPDGLVFTALLLGLFCGLGGLLFNQAMNLGKRFFQLIKGPPMLRLGLGGLLIGVIGLWFPEVWGNGQEAIELTRGKYLLERALPMLAAVVVMKVIATAITTGSGALGGVFTPTLVVGAGCGAFFSFMVGSAIDLDPSEREALMLVGMGGICAATTHAPIASVFLIFELTQDYHIILPVMLCSISASLVARSINGDSFYTARLRSKSSALATGLEELALAGNYVRDIMRSDHLALPGNASFDTVMSCFGNRRRVSIYAVDDDGKLVGWIHIHDVKNFLNDPSLASVVIAADLTRKAISVRPEETLAGIIDRFDDPDLEELPVIRSETDPVLIGRITRRDLMACLSDEVLGQRKLRTRFRRSEQSENVHVQLPADCELDKLVVPPNFAGRSVASLELPDDVLGLIVIHKMFDGTESRLLAAPETLIPEQAELIVLGLPRQIAELRQQWSED